MPDVYGEEDEFDKALREKMAGVHNYNFSGEGGGGGGYDFGSGKKSGGASDKVDPETMGFLMKLFGGG